MDFIDRNGRIDMVELSQLILWVIDPFNNPPGVVNSTTTSSAATALPATITVAATSLPTDIGLASTVDIAVAMDNPQLVPVQGFEIRLLYDEEVFKNPSLIHGGILAGSTFFPPDDSGGGTRIAKIALAPETSACGLLGVVRLEVDLAAAARSDSPTLFSLDEVHLVVSTDPTPHDFGTVAGESLISVSGSALAFHYDANGDGKVTTEDRYVAQLAPIDVNKDGWIDALDQTLHIRGLRRREPQDIAGEP
jgi:hypothetical protein